MNKLKISLISIAFLHLFATYSTAQIVDIHSLIQREDLTLAQIEAIAAEHFKVVGIERGSGYKQYQRWLYEKKFHLREDGTFTTSDEEFDAYQNAIRKMPRQNSNQRSMMVPAWTELGPKTWTQTSGWNPGVGRLTSVAIHPSNENIIYVSSPGGGIWKSSNAGSTWSPLIDNVNSAWMDIYNLCIDPSNVNTIYAGRTSGGVLKSTDAGATWVAMGSGPSSIRKIIVHPTNSNIVLAAATNGIYRSTNGGTTWTQTQSTSKADVEFKSNDPNVVISSGTSSSSIWRSTDNGVTWTTITLPTSGRTMIGVSPASADTMYAVQASGSLFGALYRSVNAGQTWAATITGSSGINNFFGYNTDGSGTSGQATYDMAICVNRTNINEVHIAGIICFKSIDAGVSFVAETAWSLPNSIGYNHADVHSLEWVNNTIYSTSDGGIWKSTNNGNDWTEISTGLGIRQFYRIANAKTNAAMISGGAQDNGTTMRQSNGTWREWLGADGMDCIFSPTNSSICIGTSQNGSIYKTTNGGSSYSNLTNPASGAWVTPLVMHPTNHDTVYGGWNGVYRSVNGGSSWTKLSGTTITSVMSCLAVAPSNTRYIYGAVGTTLYRTSDAGATWSSVAVSGTISSICVSPLNPQKIWLTTSSTSNNVLASTNMGTTLTAINTGLPAIAARSIVVDNSANEGLYVGMNLDVYYRDNLNPAWIQHTTSLPLVAVNEVELHIATRKIRVATYGRGVWESDMQPECNVVVNAGADVTVTCSNPSTTLSATFSPAGTSNYLWSNAATTNSITVTPTVTTTYTVTVTNASGCTGVDNVVVTSIKTIPTLNAGNDVTLNCSTPTITLTATGTGNFLWSNAATTASISVTPTATTTYSVTLTNTSGCSNTDNVTVYNPVTYGLAFTNPQIIGNKLQVTLRVSTCNSFSIGSTNMRFSYNKNALSAPTVVSEIFPSPDFGTTSTTGTSSVTGIASFNTAYTGTANLNLIPVNATTIDIITIEFTITDPNQTSGLIWRATYSTAPYNASPKTVILDDDKLTTLESNTNLTNLDIPLIGQKPKMDIKVFLDNVDAITELMSNDLVQNTTFPLSDPYAALPYNTGFIHKNNATVQTTTSTIVNTPGNQGIMDWVFIELRTGTAGATSVVYTKAALLQKGGKVVDTDGVSPVTFDNAPLGNYFLTIRHRNHLGFRTDSPITFTGAVQVFDFTDNSISINGISPLCIAGPNLYKMCVGDANFDGSIDGSDSTIWEQQNGSFFNYYDNSDYSLDASIDGSDAVLWEINNGKYEELD
jgi:photosystem II stability/assembly factor-like uncharacterized protein